MPDGSKKWLIRIPRLGPELAGRVPLSDAGAHCPRTPWLRCVSTTTIPPANLRNPNSPPKRVTGGTDAASEMSHLWLQVLPVAEGDHRAELQESVSTQQLQKYPDDFTANFRMGDLLLTRDQAAAAIPYFQRAAESDPRSVLAATELGAALFAARRLPESAEMLRHAVTIDPTYVDARFNLASVLASSGQFEGRSANSARCSPPSRTT